MSDINLTTTEYYGVSALETSTREPNQDLDKDVFLNLLITQLRYQDPLNPMDNQEMLAQLAQFSALEQMTNVAQITEKQLTHSLVGDFIQYQVIDSATGVPMYSIGQVDYVTMQGSETLIGVDGIEITIDDIINVFNSSAIQANSTAFELIGETIQAVIQVDGSEIGEQEGTKYDVVIEGEALSIVMKDKDPYVVVGTGEKAIEIAMEDIISVVENPSITGKTITAEWVDEDGETIEIEGVVQYIAIAEGGTYLYVNDIFIDFDDIKTVH